MENVQSAQSAQSGLAPVVSLRSIHKSFGDNEVLKGVTVEVYPGEVVAIIGSSGGGKSTLLRCATLLETFERGSLSFGDLTVAGEQAGRTVYSDKKTLAQAKQRFGLVFQNFNLFPHFTVMQNITDAPLRVQKRSKDEVFAQAQSLIEKMGLQGKEDFVPCDLSGGQQQRVAIARALCMNPQVLFFDEPTSALDPELTQEVLKVIRGLAAEHMTMVIVTHEMMFARDVADRVVFLDAGVVLEQGPAKDVIDNPQNDRTKAFLRKLSD